MNPAPAVITESAAPRDSLRDLAKRLVDPGDRDVFFDLVVWLSSLPADDQIGKLAKLLGFITLVGNKLPEAISDQAAIIRGLVQTNEAYHRTLNDRLSALPEEIGKGVDVAKFSAELAESFRQQLAETGLDETADFLEDLVPDLKAISANLASIIRPVREQSQQAARALDAEIGRLNTAASSVQTNIYQLQARARESDTTATCLLCLLVLSVGFVCGLFFEKRTETSILLDLQNQVQQVQTTVNGLTPPPADVTPKLQKKKAK